MIHARSCFPSFQGSFLFFRFSFVARGFLGFKEPFSQGSANHGFSSRLRSRTPTPPPYAPAPLAPFSSFLAFSFALFFLSGLLGGHPGSFSQRTPVPPPTPPARKKRARRLRLGVCVCVSTPVSKDFVYSTCRGTWRAFRHHVQRSYLTHGK